MYQMFFVFNLNNNIIYINYYNIYASQWTIQYDNSGNQIATASLTFTPFTHVQTFFFSKRTDTHTQIQQKAGRTNLQNVQTPTLNLHFLRASRCSPYAIILHTHFPETNILLHTHFSESFDTDKTPKLTISPIQSLDEPPF